MPMVSIAPGGGALGSVGLESAAVGRGDAEARGPGGGLAHHQRSAGRAGQLGQGGVGPGAGQVEAAVGGAGQGLGVAGAGEQRGGEERNKRLHGRKPARARGLRQAPQMSRA